MNHSFIAPAFLRLDTVARARRLRRGLLLSGATGTALLGILAPLRAQSLESASTSTSSPRKAGASSSVSAARALLNRARAQEAAGSVALAAVQLREALVLAPGDATVVRELASFYTRQNRTEEAAVQWKRLLVLKRGDAQATRELARLGRVLPANAVQDTGAADVAPLPPAVTSRRVRINRVAASSAISALAPAPIGSIRDELVSDSTLVAQAGPEGNAPMADSPVAPTPDLPAAPSPQTDVTPDAPGASATAATDAAPAANDTTTTSNNTVTAPLTTATPAPLTTSVPATASPAPGVRSVPLAARPAINSSPIPFSFPERQIVRVSKKSKAAAYPFVNAGARLLKAGRTSEALAKYERAAEIDPSNPYAVPGIATSYLILGRFDEAATNYLRYLSLSPGKTKADVKAKNDALRGLANSLSYGKRYREALGVNAFIMDRTPDSVESAFQNGEIYTYLKAYPAADSAFTRADSLEPGRADVLTAWGESLSYRRDPRAVSVFTRALAAKPPGKSRVNPFKTRATLGLGNYYLYTSAFTKAAPLYRAVLKTQPNNPTALLGLADALSFVGRPNEALSFYKTAQNLKLAPSDADRASIGLGLALVYSGRYTEGARRLNAIVAAQPNNVRALGALALAQSQIPGARGAEATYARLLKLQSDPAERALTLASIGDLRLGRDDIPGATRVYVQASQLAPRDIKINLVYAQLLSYGQQWAATATAARHVLALAPNDPQALALLLKASLEIGDLATATPLGARLINENPNNAEDSLALAQALRRAGLPTDPANSSTGNPQLLDASRRLLMRAASQVTDPKTALRIADATRDTAEDYPTAIALYRRLLEVDSSNQQARLGLAKTLFYSDRTGDPRSPLTDESRQQIVTFLAAQSTTPSSPNELVDAQVIEAQLQMRLQTPEALDSAVTLANAILTRDPNNSDARAIVAQALSTRGSFASAVEQFRASLREDPNNLTNRIGLARNLNYARDFEASIAEYRDLIRRVPLETTPRLELAQILLDRGSYPEAEALFNEVLLLRRNVAFLPEARRAIASNSVQRLSPLTEFYSPLRRSAALLRPRSSDGRGVKNQVVGDTRARRLFAQNTTVSGPTLPAAQGDLGAGNSALPNTSGGAPATTSQAPTNSQVTPATPETVPSTVITEGNPTGAQTSPPVNNGTTAGDTTTGQTTTGGTTTGDATTAGGPFIDSPVAATATTDQLLALRGLGESRLRQNLFSSALDFFTRALTFNPNDAPSRVGLARAQRGLGQLDAARQSIETALGNSPGNLQALVLRAQLLNDAGDSATASTQLADLVASLPQDAPLESYSQLALALNSVGRYPTSLELLDRAATRFPTEPSVARLRAQTLGFSGQTDAAIAAFEALSGTDPRDQESILGKARVQNYANRLPDAETTYRELLQLDSNNNTVKTELADVLGRRGNFSEAIQLDLAVLNATPDDVATRVRLARLQRSAGQSSDAETTLNAVFDKDPNNVDALIERGLIRGTSGNYAPALADLNRAISLAPNNEQAQLGLAQVQSYAGNYTESIASYQAFLARNPNDANARIEFAQTLSYANRSTEALRELDTVLGQTPNEGRALLVRADILSRSGKPDDAVAIYNTLLTQDPKNAAAQLGLADALLYGRRYSDAINAYDAILASDPNNTTARLSRARALSYGGRSEEAVAALRAIVAADAGNFPARLALAEAGANSGNATLQRDAIGEYRAILKDQPDNLNAQLGLARVLSYRGKYGESERVLNQILAANPGNNDARLALADTQRYAGNFFDAKKNYQIVGQSGAAGLVLAEAGLSSIGRATSPSIGVSGTHYHDTNGVTLNSVGENAIYRTRAFSLGLLADQGRFRQGARAQRNRRNVGILLARQFGPVSAQLIVSRLKYSNAPEKTLYSLGFNRDFSPRRRVNISFARRDIFESDLAVGRGITANTINFSGSTPITRRFDLDLTSTYYRYSDKNSRLTISPALMFRFKPNNPSLRIGVGYTYDNTDKIRDAPFVYYTPQNFNAAAILADYIVTTGRTRYGLSGAIPLTGSTGQNGINRPADTLFGFYERDLGDNLQLNLNGGIVRVPNGSYRSEQVSGSLNYFFK